MTGLLVAAGVLLAATALLLVRRARDGRLRSVGPVPSRPVPSGPVPSGPAPSEPVQRIDQAELGAQLGARATLLQFSSAFCAPCRATRRVLADVAGMVEGVVHVEIDAESHLKLVNRLAVRRTPTVLVLDATGRVVTRASGAPRKADVIAAVGAVVGAVVDASAESDSADRTARREADRDTADRDDVDRDDVDPTS